MHGPGSLLEESRVPGLGYRVCSLGLGFRALLGCRVQGTEDPNIFGPRPLSLRNMEGGPKVLEVSSLTVLLVFLYPFRTLEP